MNSYGFRPKRGTHDALRKCQDNLSEGYHYVVDLDEWTRSRSPGSDGSERKHATLSWFILESKLSWHGCGQIQARAIGEQPIAQFYAVLSLTSAFYEPVTILFTDCYKLIIL